MTDNDLFDVESFLSSCRTSSKTSFDHLSRVLDALENPATRSNARRFLGRLHSELQSRQKQENTLDCYHFSMDWLCLDNSQPARNLLLLQLPSTFTPEEWSFTFYEGLMRYKKEDFLQQTIAELGCGNGWISLAMAALTPLKKIIGLDINPKAIVCAKINLFLNAMTDDGQLQFDHLGKSLIDRVEFHVSDLLSHCFKNNLFLDKVIGCIPQVCLPDSHLLAGILSENVTDEALHALSNYCEKQGYVEDQFGLGLIARATEESVRLLNPHGKMIFNLGGRPGQQVLNRLFHRRGCATQTIWQTKIEQAGDTDILPLVEIETKTFHRFEFFMNRNATESISARTALAYAQHKGQIYHSLRVVEVSVIDLQSTKQLLESFKQPEYQAISNVMDLDYSLHALVEEKVSFLSHLAKKLSSMACFPYNETNGDVEFRSHLAEFFRLYWHVAIEAQDIIIAPSRSELIKNMVLGFQIKKALIDGEIARLCPQEWLQSETDSTDKKIISVLECPHNSQSICHLIEAFKPQLVVCRLTTHEVLNRHAFAHLVDTSQKLNCFLVLDLSHDVQLESTIQTNGVFEYLSSHSIPNHVILLCSFIHNKLYQDLNITFLASQNSALLKNLEHAAELTYSRGSFLAQEYYRSILEDLLRFQMKSKKQKPHLSTGLQDQVTRLDYGENALETPLVLKACLLESMSRQHISKKEAHLEDELAVQLSLRFGLMHADPNDFVLGGGIAPLFARICEYCAKSDITLLFPQGSYGYFLQSAAFFKAKSMQLETSRDDCFKITPALLQNFFSKNPSQTYFLFLNAPVVNPTGQIYSTQEINALFDIVCKHKSTVVFDTIFSGLEFQQPESGSYFEFLNDPKAKDHFILLGGISKEFAAGGLRFGYAYVQNPDYQKDIFKHMEQNIGHNLKYSLKKFYEILNSQHKGLQEHLDQQRNTLKNRALILSETLAKYGWDPLPCHGGLFLIAKPSDKFGKNAHQHLFEKTKLLVNDPDWIGIPEYCRFVLSVTEQQFQTALEKIHLFWSDHQ